jgi:DUF971 family protein
VNHIPTGIKANRNTSILSIEWKDGHESEYPLALLRYACPCVECRGGHDQMSDEPDPEVFSRPLEDAPQTRIVSIEAVGSYAISIQWEDGHSAGIYNWDYLRRLCPCLVCQGSRSR